MYKVKCPRCGKNASVEYAPDAYCKGVYIKCKGRHCGVVFEVVVRNGRQHIGNTTNLLEVK